MWPTTKYVPCSCKSAGTAARKNPVTPPSVNVIRKPSANKHAAENSIEPPQRVAIHEKILIPVGMAMSIVMIMKGSCSHGAMPEVNM